MITPKELILIIIWGFLAFIIQPRFIVWRLSILYRSKKWVEDNLEISHKTLVARLETDFIPMVDASVSKHLQTFKASLFRPIQSQAHALNGEIEGAIDDYVGDQVDPLAGMKEEAMNRYLKKYPLLSFIPDILKAKQGDGQRLLPDSGRRGGGG